jgi:hypothetical protein
MLALVAGSMLGIPHYVSTFAFFFWDETREYHRARWALFFGGPVLIVATLVCVALFRVPFVIQVVVYVWNTFHVARQSCGILSIYRQRANVKDPGLKPIVNGAVMWTSFALAFWNIQWYPTLNRFLTLIWPQLPQAVWVVTATGAAIALARLAISLGQRFRGANPPLLPEMVFLATSLLLFHPYLWIQDANRATLGMLLGHFIQYLAIVWLVHRRRFRAIGSSTPPNELWLGKLSTCLPLLLAVIVVLGGAFVALELLSRSSFLLQTVYEGTYLSLALVHFYLDGLFWAFRRPEVRQSLGPHLMGVRRTVPAASAG